MESMSLFAIASRGGILIIPIAICSVIVVAVAVERYLTYRRLTINIPQFMMKIRYPLSRGDILGAVNECQTAKGPVAAVVRAGLEKAKHGRENVREAMETAGNLEVFHLELHLSVLATLSGIAPLIGFLGTVTGMIKAFMKIQQLAGNVNADVLAGGIWEAMVTTAAGLSVGIPAMILYNYYVNRVKGFTYEMESVGEEVLDILSREEQPEDEPNTPGPDDFSKDRHPEPDPYRSEEPSEPDPYRYDRPSEPEDHRREHPSDRLPDDDERMRLADESFNPDDFTSDGGKNA